MTPRVRKGAGVAAVALLAGLGASAGEDPPARAVPAKAPGLPRLMFLEPGTVVAGGPPKGFNHLVLRSLPRLATGDLDTLPSLAASTATLFRTAIAADVRRGEDGFVLSRIGIGLCVPSRGGETVVDAGHVEGLDEPLGFLQSSVLEAAEAELKRGRLALRTPTFALFRAPATRVVAGRHAAVHLYYAFRVEPRSGRLAACVWSMDAAAGNRPAPREVVELTPAVAVDCGLDVKANRLLGSIPVSWSFAMTDMPPGRRVGVGEALGGLMARADAGQDVARDLEVALARALDAPGAAARPPKAGWR